MIWILDLGDCRKAFGSLRERVLGRAESLSLSGPPAETLANLNDLSGLIDQIAETEIRQSNSEEVRSRALSVLDRVLAISHVSASEFAPLRESQEQAHDLRESVATGHWAGLPAETEKLAEGGHHYADLLSLIEHPEDLSDEAWAELHDSVGRFDNPMAAAAGASSCPVLGPRRNTLRSRKRVLVRVFQQMCPVKDGTHEHLRDPARGHDGLPRLRPPADDPAADSPLTTARIAAPLLAAHNKERAAEKLAPLTIDLNSAQARAQRMPTTWPATAR